MNRLLLVFCLLLLSFSTWAQDEESVVEKEVSVAQNEVKKDAQAKCKGLVAERAKCKELKGEEKKKCISERRDQTKEIVRCFSKLDTKFGQAIKECHKKVFDGSCKKMPHKTPEEKKLRKACFSKKRNEFKTCKSELRAQLKNVKAE